MAKTKTYIKVLLENCIEEIHENSNGFYGSGLSSEGYAGGYRDALEDVLIILRGENMKYIAELGNDLGTLV